MSLRLDEPTDVQRKAQPVLLERKGNGKEPAHANVAIQAHTGSGKTLAYLLPALTNVLRRTDDEGHVPWPLVAVIAPSRELAVQIRRVTVALLGGGDVAKDAVALAIGGTNPARQTKHIRRTKPLVVVGTPGRVRDLVTDGAIGLHELDVLVLDEADELAQAATRERRRASQNDGATPPSTRRRREALDSAQALQYLLGHAGRRAAGGGQAVYVSATLRVEEAEELARSRHESVASAPCVKLVQGGVLAPVEDADADDSEAAPAVGALLPPTITHVFVRAPPKGRARAVSTKAEMVRKLFHALDGSVSLPMLAFVRAAGEAHDVAGVLRAKRGLEIDLLTGDEEKEERANAVRRMGGGATELLAAATDAASIEDEDAGGGAGVAPSSDVLVVTDVGARGLDTTRVDVVVHVDLPESGNAYVHRSGRTARMGRRGIVVSFVPEGDEAAYRRVLRAAGVSDAEEVVVREGKVWFTDDEMPPPASAEASRKAKPERQSPKAKRAPRSGPAQPPPPAPPPSSAPSPRPSTFDSWSVPHSVRRRRPSR